MPWKREVGFIPFLRVFVSGSLFNGGLSVGRNWGYFFFSFRSRRNCISSGGRGGLKMCVFICSLGGRVGRWG